MEVYKIGYKVKPYLEIITPYVSLERFLSEALTNWFNKLSREKQEKVLDGICRRIDRGYQKCIAEAKIFVEQTWAGLLKSLDEKLERGEISLAKYYEKRNFIEDQLNNLDTLNIAENYQRREIARDIKR